MPLDLAVNQAINNVEPQYVLCDTTGRLAEQGWCPVHHGDACLRTYLQAKAVVARVTDLVELARDEGWPPPNGVEHLL